MQAAELYQRVRRRLDIQPGEYLDDLEIGQVCAEQYIELWDLLLSTMGDEAPWERVTLSTVANNDTLSIAAATGIHRIVRVDMLGPGGIWEPLQSFALGDEPIDNNSRDWTSPRSVRYCARRSAREPNSALVGLSVGAFAKWEMLFSPKPAKVYSVRIFYLAPPRIITAMNPGLVPAVTYSEFPDEYPEYVVDGACVEFTKKQELDPSPFQAGKDRIAAMIERYYRPHQITQTRSMLDVRRYQTDGVSEAYEFQNRGRYR